MKNISLQLPFPASWEPPEGLTLMMDSLLLLVNFVFVKSFYLLKLEPPSIYNPGQLI